MEIRVLQNERELAKATRFYEEVGYKFVDRIHEDFVLGAFDDHDDLVGLVRLAKEQGELVLRGMQIGKTLQRQGLGTKLLKALEPHIHEDCYCLPYERLLGFYGKIGFAQISAAEAPAFLAARREAYSQKHPDIVLMKRAWSPSVP